jgi:glycerol-3-phosphate dehydrogenase subunit C
MKLNDPTYWDKSALARDLERAYEICHGCRLCFNLCPSFPELFGAIDRHGGDAHAVTAAETDRVIDTCYQCKLCYVKCPYTPDCGHEYALDFPRLLVRANAIRRKNSGLDLRAKLLSRPEMMGRLGGLAPRAANWANRQPLMRRALEQVAGIHRDKLLPEYPAEPFESWFRRQPARGGEEVVLFTTCFVNHYNPQIGKDAVEVFARNGLALVCPEQNCCGMPALDAGDMELAKKLARANVASLVPYIERGRKVVAIDPSCSYMMRKEYPELLGTEEARKLAAGVMDICEFLFQRKQAGQFNREFRSTPGKIAYHLPCHLKAQNIGYRSRDLLKLIPGVTVRLVDQCTGHDGTWAMKKEFFPLSLLAGEKAFRQMKEAQAETFASDCPMAALHFEQGAGLRPIHPIQVLARAYRADGFPRAVEEQVAGH